MSVEYTESAEVAGSPPDGCTELPTCPVCLGESSVSVSDLFFLSSDRLVLLTNLHLNVREI